MPAQDSWGAAYEPNLDRPGLDSQGPPGHQVGTFLVPPDSWSSGRSWVRRLGPSVTAWSPAPATPHSQAHPSGC